MARSLRLRFLSTLCSLGLTGCLHLSKDLLPPVDVSPSLFRPLVGESVVPAAVGVENHVAVVSAV